MCNSIRLRFGLFSLYSILLFSKLLDIEAKLIFNLKTMEFSLLFEMTKYLGKDTEKTKENNDN